MRNRKVASIIIVLAISGLIVLSWAEFTEGFETRYEIHPNIIRNPEPRTETTRIIEAYDHLIERMIDLMEQNVLSLGPQIHDIKEQLLILDKKVDNLGLRLTAIEKGLKTGAKPTSGRTSPKKVQQSQNSTKYQPDR